MRWIIAAVVLLLVALFLRSGLIAYAMYVLLGLLLVSRWIVRDGLSRLVASRECDDSPAEVGQTRTVKLVLRNTGRMPVPWVLCEDLLPRTALRQKPTRLKIEGKRLKIGLLWPGGELTIRYKITFALRGFYQIGPLVLEGGDLFGLHRRHRVVTEPVFILVYPPGLPLDGYDIASRRPIGQVRLIHRLYEDPTRHAGIRPYQTGDPLQRIHWRATARTGQLHSKLYDPTTLAGMTILLDFHSNGYPKRGEPYRSELAVLVAATLAYAVARLGEQVGLFTNGHDAADRIRAEAANPQAALQNYRNRRAARQMVEMLDRSDRLRPLFVATRRGEEQFQRIRELLARVEVADGLECPSFIREVVPRLPRNATVLAVLPAVTGETAAALGQLRRNGFAVTAVLIGLSEDAQVDALAQLRSQSVRDVRHVASVEQIPALCQPLTTHGSYALASRG